MDVEPANGPEASWAVPLAVPWGRIYVLYTYNRDNVRVVPNVASPGIAKRVDTLGIWAFKYSEDNGQSWSRDRFEIPLRPWDEDDGNNFEGRQRFFWSVAKPVIDRGTAFIGFARISKWGTPGVLMRSRAFAVSSANILTEKDPSKIRWTMLPQQPAGLRAPKGPIAEETNITALSDGSLYALYRTIDGYPCHAYSKDRGLTWTDPAYATYASNGGRRLKNPRAFTFARRFSNGKYLLWFHNQGGEAVHARARWDYYQDRNPGWVCGGIEKTAASTGRNRRSCCTTKIRRRASAIRISSKIAAVSSSRKRKRAWRGCMRSIRSSSRRSGASSTIAACRARVWRSRNAALGPSRCRRSEPRA